MNIISTDIEQGFMPWLMDTVKEQLEKAQLGRMVLDGILREVVSKRFDQYAKLDEQLRERLGGSASAAPKPDQKPADSSNNAETVETAPAAATTSVEVNL